MTDERKPQLEPGVELDPAHDQEDDETGMSFQRYVILIGGGLAGLILLIFLTGLALALLSASGVTATRISMIRDIFIIILALEFILVIMALVVLIMQIARLILMLQNEIKPILTDTRDTATSAKGTAQFVGKNVTRPLIRSSAFLAGASTFLRELGGIRRAIKRQDPQSKQIHDQHDEGEKADEQAD
jgi:hypothetical protein